MQIYSYLFHGLLALFLLAVSAVTLASGAQLHLEILPWPAYALLAAAVFGLISLLLALRKTARLLFFLWSLAVFVMLVRGYFLSSYRFNGSGAFHNALYLTLGSLLAILGAWLQLRRKAA